MNPMFEFLKQFNTPQAFMENAIKNSAIAQNPVGQNAIDMIRKGDSKGLESLGRNLCREMGMDPDETLKQVQSMFK